MTERPPLSDADRQRLATLLAAYGADPARWPAADRERLARHLEDAGPDVAEARAMDSALAASADPTPPPQARDRLMARVQAMPRATPAASPAAVIPLTPRRSRMAAAPAWLALAASLALGFWIGSLGLVDGLLLDGYSDSDWSAIDLGEDPGDDA